MPYMLAPGARLYVGPHGQMEESLGACCAPCAAGGPCATGLGAATKNVGKEMLSKDISLAIQTLPLPLAPTPAQAAAAAAAAVPAPSSNLLLYGALVGVAALGGLYLWKRKEKR